MASLDFIMQNSETAQQYENITVMAWAHSNLHINDSDCYMSSKDLHYQFKLEKRFPNIQSLVVQVGGNHVKGYDMYNLNDDGRTQLLKCHKKPGTVHGCCSRRDFYIKAKYSFQDMELKISDFMDFSQNLYMNPDVSYNENIISLDGMNDDSDIEENVTFVYPKGMISHFKEKAKKYDVEIMAYIVGYREDNVLTATELIYPNQYGTKNEVHDTGKINCEYK